MERGIDITEYRVIDPQTAGHPEQGVTQHRHIRQELRAEFRFERIQIRDDRIGQQEAVAGQHLAFSHDHPARTELRNGRWMGGRSTAFDHGVNGGGRRLHCESACATAAASTGGAELPKFERTYDSSAAASADCIQPNCSICVEYRPAGMEAGLCPFTTQRASSAGSPSTTGEAVKLGYTPGIPAPFC